MSAPAKKARYQQELRQVLLFPTQPTRTSCPDDDATSSSILVDLFRSGNGAARGGEGPLEGMNVISGKFSSRSSSQEWFDKTSGSVCPLRIEARVDDCENEERNGGGGRNGGTNNCDRAEGQERILLFRSGSRGAIGKVVYSYVRCDASGEGGRDDDVAIRAKIHVVDVKDAYRGFDLGGLLVSLAVEKLQERFRRCDSRRRRRDVGTVAAGGGCAKCTAGSGRQSITISLDAEEDSRRHNRLVMFYRRLGFDARRTAKVSYLNNNDGETIRKVPMHRALSRDACENQGLLLLSLVNESAAFLPVSFFSTVSGRMVHVGTLKSPFRRVENWLLESKSDHEGRLCFISTTGRALALSDLCSGPTSHEYTISEPMWFLLRRVENAADDVAAHFWILEAQPDRYLACDPYRRRLVLSPRPILWCCDPDNLQLLCLSDDTSGLREHYRVSWKIQTVSFVQRMRERYQQFTLRPMTLQQAMQLAASVPADPFSERLDGGPSLQTLCLATAELARNLDQPDWVLLLALVYHLGRLVPTLDDLGCCSPSDDERHFDWTPDIESRVVGHPAPPSAKFYEFRNVDEDREEMEECCSGADRMYGDSRGLDDALLTFTGPEYVYHWLRHNQAQLPDEGLSMVRLASLVDWHSRGAYRDLSRAGDMDVMPFVVEFHEIVRRAWWETASLTASKDVIDRDDFEILWSTKYADLASKYGLDDVLMW